ncbi:MAG: hypothetical protein JNK05_39290 [Myxococcales bacterium]|jgi:phage/plasmid primase-like uncharacterized protein|nr:hypothetical protein [Myxococcales bacterium]
MKKEKRLTKSEKKALKGPVKPAADQHIHCIACGRHLDTHEFDGGGAATAKVLYCQHGSGFPSCTACTAVSQALLDEHDRTNQPVKPAAAWH